MKTIFTMLLATSILFCKSQDFLDSTMKSNVLTELEGGLVLSEVAQTDVDRLADHQEEIYLAKKININQATEEQLSQTGAFSPIQILSIVQYRTNLGELKEWEELQAVPYWSLQAIEMAKFYFDLETSAFKLGLIDFWRQGDSYFSASLGWLMTSSKGYLPDSVYGKRYYAGPPINSVIRFGQRSDHGIQWGLTLENDRGEPFLWNKRYRLFDHLSKSVSYIGKGLIKTIVVGDFQVNLAEGLTHWQSYGIGNSSSDIAYLFRSAPVIKSYVGKGENNSQSGLAVRLEKGRWSFFAWLSYALKDANIVVDSINNVRQVRSFDESGLHRSDKELENKNNVKLTFSGCRLMYQNSIMKLGLNFLNYQMNSPLQRDTSHLYRLYDFSGKNLFNFSTDYRFQYKNAIFWGEIAASIPGGLAWLNNLVVSITDKQDLALIYRKIAPNFNSFYANASVLNSVPKNEISFSLIYNYSISKKSKLSIRIDHIKRPWLRYQDKFPSNSDNFLLNWDFKPNKHTNMKCRFASIALEEDSLGSGGIISSQNSGRSHQLYVDLHQQASNFTAFKYCFSIKKVGLESIGMAILLGLHRTTLQRDWKFGVSLGFFSTTDYLSRLYMIDNELFEISSLQSFFGQGSYLSFRVQKKLSSKCSAGLSLATFYYHKKGGIGSGYDFINGKIKSEVFMGIRRSF